VLDIVAMHDGQRRSDRRERRSDRILMFHSHHWLGSPFKKSQESVHTIIPVHSSARNKLPGVSFANLMGVEHGKSVQSSNERLRSYVGECFVLPQVKANGRS
jgi:hypothetical protein